MYIAAAVLSRRRFSRSSSPPPSPPPSPSRHHYHHHSHRHRHRHRDPHRRCAPGLLSHSRPKSPSKKLPLVKQTRATEIAYNSRDTLSKISEDDAYAHAMAARARLHARLHTGDPLVTSTLRSSSSALVRQEEPGTCKYSKKPTGSSPPDVHTQSATTMSPKPYAGPSTDKRLSEKPVCFKTSKQDEDLLSEPDVCSICLESFSMGKILVCFPCKHRFHHHCLVAWLEAHLQCPNCRSTIIKVGFFQASVEYFNALYGTHIEDFAAWVTPCKNKMRTQLSK